jgi:hypothetical protein
MVAPSSHPAFAWSIVGWLDFLGFIQPVQKWEFITMKKALDQRVHQCSQCGCVEDRDVADAKVMLNWALGLGTSLTNAESPSSTLETRSTGSLKPLGAKKRQKLLAVGEAETPPSACGGE